MHAVTINAFTKNNTPEELPVALSNNSVAGFEQGSDFYMASFYGLTAHKSWRDIVPSAYLWSASDKNWQQLPDIPGTGRLASAAVAMQQKL